MSKLTKLTIAIVLTLCSPRIAIADTYSDFIKTQLAEFQNVGGDRCKVRSKEVMEGGNKIVYDLCIFQGKAVFLRGSNEGTPFSVSEYNKGKLVQISLWEGTGGVGFRNGQPVVEWSSGEFSKRRVNWKLTPAEKSKYLADAAKENSILLKFGIR
jgi:hypothetical protein